MRPQLTQLRHNLPLLLGPVPPPGEAGEKDTGQEHQEQSGAKRELEPAATRFFLGGRNCSRISGSSGHGAIIAGLFRGPRKNSQRASPNSRSAADAVWGGP